MTNQYGRQWEEIDALKWQAAIHKRFVVLGADGSQLCGRYVEDQPLEVIVDGRWK